MINANMTFIVDYNRSFAEGWPRLQDMLERAQQKKDTENQFSLLVYAMHKLAPFIGRTGNEVIHQLTEEEMNTLVVGFANQYIVKIKEAIAKNEYGRLVKIKDLSIDIVEGKLVLRARGVKPKYRRILNLPKIRSMVRSRAGKYSTIVVGGLKILCTLVPGVIERQALERLWNADLAKSMKVAMCDKTREYGMYITITDCDIQKCPAGEGVYQADQPGDWMPDDLKIRLANVLSRYLNDRTLSLPGLAEAYHASQGKP